MYLFYLKRKLSFKSPIYNNQEWHNSPPSIGKHHNWEVEFSQETIEDIIKYRNHNFEQWP